MTAYVDLPGSGTTRISTPDSAALSLLGDLDVRALISMVDWTPAAIQGILSHWNTAGNQRSWSFQVNTNGTLSLAWSVLGDATVITVNSTVAPVVANGSPLWVRVVHDVDNGAVGNDVLFYTSTDPITTALGAVTWVQLGTTVTTAATTSHHNSTTTPLIGAITVGSSIRLIGKVYVTEWRSVIAGTVVANPDFRSIAQSADGGLTFVGPAGNTWTLQTAALWVGPPGNVAATPNSATQITVSWDNLAAETGYIVERSPDGVGSWTNVSGTLAANTVSYANTGLDCATQYFYRVSAVFTVGTSAPGTVVNATTSGLVAPANPGATTISSSQIDVDWDDVASETGYRVERSLTGVGGWSNVSGTLAAGTTTYSNTGLTGSTQYFYQVIAQGAGCESTPSSVVDATTSSAPPAPIGAQRILRSPRYGLTRSHRN